MTNFQRLIPFKGKCSGIVPTDAQCFKLWDYYQMLSNIRIHSLRVADIATCLGELALSQGWKINLQAIRAAALLHDLGKTYALRFGGNHSQIGAVWALHFTRNPAIAQGIIHHVYWPGKIDIQDHILPLSIIYADKRVKHDQIVSLQERITDILERYGSNSYIVQRIQRSFNQVKCIEKEFSTHLKVNLNAYTFNRRRMV